METIKPEDIIEKTTVEPSSTEPIEQDPLKEELEKVQKKEGRTKAEKLLYTKRRIEEQLQELGIEEDKQDEDEDKPLTVGMFKKMQQENASKTALQLAEDIESESERELTKYHLENTIKSSGNPSEDLRLARAIVNAAKNRQILEEVARKPEVKNHSSASGVPARHQEEQELTQEELQFTKQPFNLTKEQIIAARKK